VNNRFYSPGEQRAAQVQKLFAAIARRYDLLNDVLSVGLHRCWKRRLVKLAGRPRAALDLCCGTGDIALRFTGNVVGADFSEEMLRVAKARCSRAPARDTTKPRAGSRLQIQWIQADAVRLPFADDSFDVVVVGYGLRNLADLPGGLREIWRVLRPGGQLLSLDFGKPECGVWRRLYFAHLRFWVPVLGWMIGGERDAYAYILTSLENYPAQRGVQQLMEKCGFIECGFEGLLGGAMAINLGRKPATAVKSG
jgi:demethylmenaquinone methyltransferase/2-methoxy-6-polyprenyl-1,4-benzoquinol methylase